MQRTEPELERKIVRSERKSLASQHRLKVLTVDWPVVALASLGQESGSPNTQLNATLRNKGPTLFVLRHTSVRWPTYSGWANRASPPPLGCRDVLRLRWYHTLLLTIFDDRLSRFDVNRASCTCPIEVRMSPVRLLHGSPLVAPQYWQARLRSFPICSFASPELFGLGNGTIPPPTTNSKRQKRKASKARANFIPSSGICRGSKL
jgi:hypothetical protein